MSILKISGRTSKNDNDNDDRAIADGIKNLNKLRQLLKDKISSSELRKIDEVTYMLEEIKNV